MAAIVKLVENLTREFDAGDERLLASYEESLAIVPLEHRRAFQMFFLSFRMSDDFERRLERSPELQLAIKRVCGTLLQNVSSMIPALSELVDDGHKKSTNVVN
ncbi:MAG: hypothetical protein A2831_03355 [Candidatus Yanofskybacteria bacterium RIFCSPHIGHO2_01_FULL_44_17]|uniref:Uncharacterized protein n=1 Tax=Candidatus Yanofskybacteria bacterium RIFCSPHIGHO2_01_FULL_44_17 TaxID=1802668 RepID=A0A1F8EZU8_9BACT|nr:MAG: hypothetical protein A2831_03355 [Candidatus Yanofskybacteria bacterium RIFCSPHIGHO2_01_FULL_44_17]